MISGQARKELEEIGRDFQAAIPSVITGKKHILETNSNGPKNAIPFKTGAGNVTIEVCLEG